MLSIKINTLRGLHYQTENPQAKLIHVVSGAVMDIVVDLRAKSSSFGKNFSVVLSAKNHRMLFVPEGFAHGYLVLEKNTVVHYKCTNYYDSKSEHGIRWDDPDININWGVKNPILSTKDNELPFLKDQKNVSKLMKYVLVTGGCGFIGSNFVKHLISLKNYFPIVLDKLTYASSVESLSHINKKRFDFIEGDICDETLVNRIFNKNKFDGVFHFAAESHVDRSIDGPENLLIQI